MIKANITGAWYSSRNAGDQAILVTIRKLLETRLPELRLQVICSNDGFVRSEHGMPALSQNRSLARVLMSVLKDDALLIGGGTPFYNDFKHMAFFWVLAVLCRLGGGKLIVYGASSQNLQSASARWFTRGILRMSHLITVREELTRQRFLKMNIGRPVECTADPAITLEPCAEERIEEIFREEGLAGLERPLFAVCPHYFSNRDAYRVHHYEKFANDSIERQTKVLSGAIEYLSGIGQVILLPMNVDEPDSDLNVQRDIRARLGRGHAVKVIERQYRPSEIAGIFSRCHLTVGVRLHALIMAAAVGCPIIAVNYAPKVQGFMELLGSPEDMLDLKTLTLEQLQARLGAYLDDYENRRQAHAQRVERLKGRARKNADLVAELFGPGQSRRP